MLVVWIIKSGPESSTGATSPAGGNGILHGWWFCHLLHTLPWLLTLHRPPAPPCPVPDLQFMGKIVATSLPLPCF